MSGLIAKKTNDDFTSLPDGVYNAVCYGIWDLGTQLNERWKTIKHNVLISWEIPSKKMIIKKDGVEEEIPRVISKIYTLSLNDRSNLKRDLESWRGRAFTKEEIQSGFDLKKILGAPCLLQIANKEANGKIYINVMNVIPPPKGKTIKPTVPMVFFSLDDDDEIPESTPDWIRKIIEESNEWKEKMGLGDGFKQVVDNEEDENDDDNYDDIPF